MLTFLKTMTPFKAILLQVAAAAFTVAAYFGFRCPAQGCPGCRLMGK